MAIGGWKSSPQRRHWFAVIVFIGGCTAISTAQFDRLYLFD